MYQRRRGIAAKDAMGQAQVQSEEMLETYMFEEDIQGSVELSVTNSSYWRCERCKNLFKHKRFFDGHFKVREAGQVQDNDIDRAVQQSPEMIQTGSVPTYSRNENNRMLLYIYAHHEKSEPLRTGCYRRQKQGNTLGKTPLNGFGKKQ